MGQVISVTRSLCVTCGPPSFTSMVFNRQRIVPISRSKTPQKCKGWGGLKCHPKPWSLMWFNDLDKIHPQNPFQLCVCNPHPVEVSCFNLNVPLPWNGFALPPVRIIQLLLSETLGVLILFITAGLTLAAYWPESDSVADAETERQFFFPHKVGSHHFNCNFLWISFS